MSCTEPQKSKKKRGFLRSLRLALSSKASKQSKRMQGYLGVSSEYVPNFSFILPYPFFCLGISVALSVPVLRYITARFMREVL